VEAVEYFLLPLPAPLEVSCFGVRFRFLTLGIFCFRFQLRIKLVTSEFASASSLFCQNASFRILPLPTSVSFVFLSNCMLTAQHKTENLSVQKIRQNCLDRYHKIGWLQPSLKVVYYNFFYCRSILVVLRRAVAITGQEAKPPKKFRPSSLTKLGHLAIKLWWKKEKY